MGSSNTERQMTVPSYWEIGRLENKIAYKSNREATVGTVGAVGLTSLELALAPAVRRHHFGPSLKNMLNAWQQKFVREMLSRCLMGQLVN